MLSGCEDAAAVAPCCAESIVLPACDGGLVLVVLPGVRAVASMLSSRVVMAARAVLSESTMAGKAAESDFVGRPRDERRSGILKALRS